MNEFKNYHPVINFVYFAFVFAFSMYFMHPACLVISFISGFTYSVILNGKSILKFNILYLLPTAVIAILINPMFNHEGMTILCYLPNDNPLTLESILYGVASVGMIVCIICHFTCFNKVMTSDKFIYLLGKTIPSLSLVLSMTFRFVPRFTEQFKKVKNAQCYIGRGAREKNFLRQIKFNLQVLSIMITWSLENAIDTADSMKSRGYGLLGRTFFSDYKFTKRDFNILTAMFCLIIYILVGGLTKGIFFRYFPSLKGVDVSPYSISILSAYLLFCFIPVIIEITEELRWKKLRLKI